MRKVNLEIKINKEDFKKKLGVKDGVSPDIDTIIFETARKVEEKLKPFIPTLTQIENDLPGLGSTIRDSLELLQGEERLDAAAIKNLPEFTREIVRGHTTGIHGSLSSLADVSVNGILANQILVWDGIKWVAQTPSAGALSIIAIGGTINDSNTSFTYSTLPTLLIINGGMYQPTGGTITWSAGAGTITLSSAVGSGGSIFGI